MIPTELTEFRVNGRSYRVHAFAGAVLDHKKRSVTEVSGSGGGGGGYSYRGTGSSYTAPIRIKSTTTTHDDVILQSEDGHEQAFQLLDFDLATRSSHTLTVVWAVGKGKKEGPYFAVFNHNTGSHYIRRAALRHIARPAFLWTMALLTGSLLFLLPTAGGFAVILAPLATWMAYAVLRFIGVKRVERNVCVPLFRHLGTIAPLQSDNRLRGDGPLNADHRPHADHRLHADN